MSAFDFLRWVLSDFWRFVGVLILVGACLQGLAAVILAMRGRGE